MFETILAVAAFLFSAFFAIIGAIALISPVRFVELRNVVVRRVWLGVGEYDDPAFIRRWYEPGTIRQSRSMRAQYRLMGAGFLVFGCFMAVKVLSKLLVG